MSSDVDGHGGSLHLFTEVVQRIGGYDGQAAADAPVRVAAHRRLRTSAE